MMRRIPFILLLLCCYLGIAARAGVVLATDFERNPMAHGWDAGWDCTLGTNIRWAQRDTGGHCLEILNGRAVSPRFTVQQGQSYKLSFAAKGGKRPMWSIFFYDDWGYFPIYDHYSGIEPCTEWTTQTFCFTTKFPGVSARLILDSGGTDSLQIDDLRIETAAPADVDAWTTALEKSLPTITPPPAATNAEALLPHIRAKLRQGGPARIVILGDSIGNDLSNAPLDALLRRMYPKAQVELRFTGQGGTGYYYFQIDTSERVVKHKPDLLILLSITNRRDSDLAASLQQIIDNVRAALPETDILLVTPHVDEFSGNHFSGSAQRDILRQVAAKNALPLVDLLAAWQDYLKATGKPQDWLLRDVVHMNERGRLVSATAVAAWFAPTPGAKENP